MSIADAIVVASAILGAAHIAVWEWRARRARQQWAQEHEAAEKLMAEINDRQRNMFKRVRGN